MIRAAAPTRACRVITTPTVRFSPAMLASCAEAAAIEDEASTVSSSTLHYPNDTISTRVRMCEGLSLCSPIIEFLSGSPATRIRRTRAPTRRAFTRRHRHRIELAKDIAADGEGATRFIEVASPGAPGLGGLHDDLGAIDSCSHRAQASSSAPTGLGTTSSTVGAPRASSRWYANRSRARIRFT